MTDQPAVRPGQVWADTAPTCTYQWWHTLGDRETLTRCTKATGHDGKHEHREAAG